MCPTRGTSESPVLLKRPPSRADYYGVNVVPFVVIPPAADRPKLGSILVRKLSPEQLESALTSAVQQQQRLGEVLLKLGWTTEERIAKALAEELGLAYMDPYSASLDPSAVARLPQELAAKHCVLPIRSIDANTVVVAVADPTDSEGLAEVQKAMGCQLSLVVAERSAIEYAMMAFDKPARASPRPPPEETPEPLPAPSDMPTDLAAVVGRLVLAVEEIAGELRLLREAVGADPASALRSAPRRTA